MKDVSSTSESASISIPLRRSRLHNTLLSLCLVTCGKIYYNVTQCTAHISCLSSVKFMDDF